MPSLFEKISQVFSDIAGGPDGVHARIWQELKPWVATLMPAATRTWIPRIHSGEPCEVPVMLGGRKVRDCEGAGLLQCTICRRPACLQHAHIDKDANAICYMCVAIAMHAVPAYRTANAKQEPSRTKREPRGAPPPAPKQGPTPEQVLAALKTLGLQPGATMDQIRAAHRKLAAQHHPDRQRAAKAKATAEVKFKKVGAALDLLKRAMGETAS